MSNIYPDFIKIPMIINYTEHTITASLLTYYNLLKESQKTFDKPDVQISVHILLAILESMEGFKTTRISSVFVTVF